MVLSLWRSIGFAVCLYCFCVALGQKEEKGEHLMGREDDDGFKDNTTSEKPEKEMLQKELLELLKKMRGIDWSPLETTDIFNLVGSLICLVFYLVFITYYLSRLTGFLVTFVGNRIFLTGQSGRYSIGSFSISLLSGKIMFRHFVYVCNDFAIRIDDGWLQFRFWKWYGTKRLGQDMSNQPARIIVQLNGLEINVYNQLWRYHKICKLYEMFSMFYPGSSKNQTAMGYKPTDDSKWQRRRRHIFSLIPKIRYEISNGSLIFGTNQLPSAVVVSFENLIGHYTTKPPSGGAASGDLYMHSAGGNMENFRVSLVENTIYTMRTNSKYEPPPRTMGQGFEVLQTATLSFIYCQDVLGKVTDSIEQKVDELVPCWSTELRLGKNTVVSYGPWADKQRDVIYNFFFPPEYWLQRRTTLPMREESRIPIKYDLRVLMMHDSTVELLFMRGDEPSAIHVGVKQGSSFEVCVPWVIDADGYHSTVSGEFFDVDATTSLEYQNLIECQSVNFSAILNYPIEWNGHQQWDFNFSLNKCSCWLLYEHKDYIQDLFAEWSSDAPTDVLSFIPYTWTYTVSVVDFELLLVLNQHNWMDTSSSQNAENLLLALCGRQLRIRCDMPFTDFMTDLTRLQFTFAGDTLGLSARPPEQAVLHPIYHTLHEAAQLPKHFITQESVPLWRRVTAHADWMDMCRTPKGSVLLNYIYHSMHKEPDSNLSEEMKEILLKPWLTIEAENFDPNTLTPDLFEIDISVSALELVLNGFAVKALFLFKENYIGESQVVRDIKCFENEQVEDQFGKAPAKFLPDRYRPLRTTVHLALNYAQACCQLYSERSDFGERIPCPLLQLDQFSFEMDKQYNETIMQLALSPTTVIFKTFAGKLQLSSLQFRGHGMFSGNDLPVDSVTLEYGWLMELMIGDLTGRLHPSHLIQVGQFVDSFLLLLLADEDELHRPKSVQLCQHMKPKSTCDRKSMEDVQCLTEQQLKYIMFRLSIDDIGLIIKEDNSAIELKTWPVRVSLCNVHSMINNWGISIGLLKTQIRQFMLSTENAYRWLECGHLRLNEIKLDLSLPLDVGTKERRQLRHEFLRKHDYRSKRMAFLWNNRVPKCACIGGCNFFGQNIYGRNFFDATDRKLAVLTIREDKNSPGFGQSILPDRRCLISVDVSREIQALTPVDRTPDEEFFETSEAEPTMGADLEKESSIESFHTTVEEPDVNLYSQVNRPVFRSPLLMTHYGRYLREYDYPLVRFECVKNGLNDIVLEQEQQDGQARFIRYQSFTKPNLKAPKAGTVEVLGTLGTQVELFISPMGTEVLQRLLDACSKQLTRMHPAYIVQHMFASCSNSSHKQPLVQVKKENKKDLDSLQLHLSLPCIKVAIFQCGLVEKTIPFAHLEQAHSLVQPSVLLGSADNLTITATTILPEGTSDSVLGRVELERYHCQFLQVTSKSSGNIGLSKQSSKFHYCTNWNELSPKDEYDLCLVMEAAIPTSSVTVCRPMHFPLKEIGDVTKLAEKHEEVKVTSQQQNEDRAGTSSDDTGPDVGPKTQLIVNVGKIDAYFGLCQPVEAAGHNWPLYDVLAPSLSAWIHVSHRLVVSCTAINSSCDLWRHLILSKLLTDAFDCRIESVFVSSKSKFTEARPRSKYLRGCPSCQVLLTLLKFCAYVGIPPDHETVTLQCGTDLCNSRIRRKALVVLFSHWQTFICAEKLVTLLDPKIAKKFEMKSEPKKVPKGPEGTDASTSSSDSSTENTARPLVNKRPSQGSALRDPKTGSQHSHAKGKRPSTSATPSGTGSPRSTLQKQQTGETQDLYTWMLEQHKKHRKDEVRTDDRDRTENLMEIMLNVCFWPLFKSFELDPPGVRVSLMEVLGSTVNLKADFDGCEVDVVEPKLLQILGHNTKRIGHKLHKFLHIEPLSITAQLEYGDEDAILVKHAALNVKYRIALNNIKLSLGLPAASFIYQMSFAIKSCIDTCDELQDAYSLATGMDLRKAPTNQSGSTQSNSSEQMAEWAHRLLDKLDDYQRSENRKSMFLEDDQGGLNTVVFGIVDLKQVLLDASLTELFVTVNLNKLQVSLQSKAKVLADRTLNEGDISLTGSLKRVMLILSQQTSDLDRTERTRTIFNLMIKENQMMVTRTLKIGKKWQNSVLVQIGPIEGDIPMDPGFLHEVVLKHGPQLNEQIERFATTAPQTLEEEVIHVVRRRQEDQLPIGEYSRSMTKSSAVAVADFNLTLKSLKISAALLPSLKATYQLDGAVSSGTTGSEAKFTVTVSSHGITFVVREEGAGTGQIEVKVALPKLTASGGYVQAGTAASMADTETPRGEGLIYQEGGYLKIDVFVGKFEHTLTTTLLNQLLFVQEAFRRELGDIVAKISAEKVPLFAVKSSSSTSKPLLYSLEIKGDTARCVQVTATTPTSVAVRLAVDHLQCQLTNRWVQKRAKERERLFGSAQIQLSLALGQLVKNAMFEEVEPEFQKYAHFVTQISAQNVETKEDERAYTYLINVNRPMIFIQPIAVDKAVLIWLNYKNTYEAWNAEREKIVQSKESHQRLSDFIKSSGHQLLENEEAPQFVKLSVVNGLHICMPLYSSQFPEANAALMIELDKTEIAVCARKDLVCRGSFSGFRIQFSEDYDGTPDNWKPSSTELPDSNYCYFPEGTYDVFSRTCGARDENSNAEWLLNVIWKVEGMQLDVNNRIGKLTSLLVTTLTSLATDNEEQYTAAGSSGTSHAADSDITKDYNEPMMDELAEVQKLPTGKARSCLLEQKMHDQSRLVSDLQQCQASELTVETERRKLKQLEAALYREFRQVMVDKLRRQSEKASILRDHFGLAIKAPSGHTQPADENKSKKAKIVRRQSDLGRKSKPPAISFHSRTTSVDATNQLSYSSFLPTIISREPSIGESTASSSASGDDSPKSPSVAADSESSAATPLFSGPSISVDAGTQPAVDLYLDIQFVVETGTWTFRTPPPKNGSMSEQKSQSSSSVKKTPSSGYRTRLRAQATASQGPPTKTTIAMPSLSVRTYYTSRSATEEGGMRKWNQERLNDAKLNQDVIEHIMNSTKKANFYMWIALQSMPIETVVTPHILDFVELTIEPLPSAENMISRSESKSDVAPAETTELEAKSALSFTDTAVTGSFPVDVVLCLSVQSSTIRFKTEDQNRMTVDCLLRLPQLKLVATSRKSEQINAPSAKRSRMLQEKDKDLLDTLCGGICVSASFTGFSLRIYCPLSDEKRYAVDVTIDTITLNLTRGSNQLSIAEIEGLKNSVKFSVLADIDKAMFSYDMRRLKELLLFPKAWYRRAIMRRLFLGDESELKRTTDTTSSTPRQTEQRISFQRTPEPPGSQSNSKTSWEALVLYGISCQELNVQAHMSNTMGNTKWITKDATCVGRVDVNSIGSKNLSLSFSLLDSCLDAAGGLISGAVSLSKFGISVNHKKVDGRPPEDQAQITLVKADSRIEWMGTTIFLGRCTNLRLSCQDEYESKKDMTGRVSRAAMFVHTTCVWNEMHLMITKTTVNEFQKIAMKLKSFFEEQLKSGLIVWSIPVTFGQETKTDKDDEETSDKKKHRWWHKPLEILTDIQLRSNFFPLPTGKDGITIIGGNLKVSGEEIALACMTDKMTNSHDWAVFHLRQPNITFSPEAQYVFVDVEQQETQPPTTTHTHSDDDDDVIDDNVGILVRQEVEIKLGHDSLKRDITETKAMFARAQRSRYTPLGGMGTQRLDQWLDYLLDSVLRQVYPNEQSASWAKGKETYDHSVMQLLRFPPLEATLTTIQQQNPVSNLRPVVRCSFVAQFEDHIYIQTNTNALFGFLPTLLKAYLSENQPLPKDSTRRDSGPLSSDNREYRCETWVVEPNIRFLDKVKWDPPGVDMLLQKLGILDQRNTIPKWTQRCFMDPCDVLLAMLVTKALKIARKGLPSTGNS